MAPIIRKRRRVPRRTGEAKPPGIFSKAKCVFVSLARSEYHRATRLQLAAASSTSSQSMRSAVDIASRRTDQLDVVSCLLRTCAIPPHHALGPRSNPPTNVEPGKILRPDRSLAAARGHRVGPDYPGRW